MSAQSLRRSNGRSVSNINGDRRNVTVPVKRIRGFECEAVSADEIGVGRVSED